MVPPPDPAGTQKPALHCGVGDEHARQFAPALPHRLSLCIGVPACRHWPEKMQPLGHDGAPPPAPVTHARFWQIWLPAHCTHAPPVVAAPPQAVVVVPL